MDTPELPDEFVCEVCGVGPELFELIEDQLPSHTVINRPCTLCGADCYVEQPAGDVDGSWKRGMRYDKDGCRATYLEGDMADPDTGHQRNRCSQD